MSRYAPMFDRLATTGDAAFGAFLMLGDPDLETSARLLDSIVEGGADMLEVGIPFSDPVADGPVIQAAAGRALRAGVRPADCFELLSSFRARHPQVPTGLLTYANLLVARGVAGFCSEAGASGVDSLLIADVPSLEAEPFARAARAAGLDYVMIVAPNTPDATVARIVDYASGYTYCVARTGVTGTRDHLTLHDGSLFAKLRSLGAPPPILGFGISTPEHVRQAVKSGAAGVIAGSALVRLVEEPDAPATVQNFVAAMKAASRG